MVGRSIASVAVVVAAVWCQHVSASRIAASTQAQVPVGQTGDSTVGGSVVDGVSGRGLSSATVTLWRVTDRVTADGRSIKAVTGSPTRVLTDSTGSFRIALVLPGSYFLSASRAGYPTINYGQSRSNDWPPAVLQVRPGESVANIALRLWRASTLEGRVLDEEREPMPDVEVRALRKVLQAGSVRFEVVARTEANDVGRYFFDRLAPGDYVIAVPAGSATWPEALVDGLATGDAGDIEATIGRLALSGGGVPLSEGIRTRGQVFDWLGPVGRINSPEDVASTSSVLVYRTRFHSSTSTLTHAQLVQVEPGARVQGIDIVMEAPQVSHTVSGQLVGPEQSTAATTVSLVPSELEGLASDRGFSAATSVTDSRGRFVFVGVPAGRYVLKSIIGGRAWAPKLGSTAALLAATPVSAAVMRAPDRSQDEILWAQTKVEVSDSSINGLSLRLQPGHRVSGRIVLPADFTGPAPPGLTQALVQLYPVDPDNESSQATTLPAANGSFQTSAHLPGRYRLFVSLIDRVWRVAEIEVNGENVLDGWIDLTDSDVSNVTVRLTNKDVVLPGHLSGDSETVEQAQIVVFPADIERWIARGMHPDLTSSGSRADSEGRFRVSNLKPGAYAVLAVPVGVTVNLADPDWVRKVAPLGTRVQVGYGSNPPIEVRVQPKLVFHR